MSVCISIDFETYGGTRRNKDLNTAIWPQLCVAKTSYWKVYLDHPIACDIICEKLLESVYVLHLYDLEPHDNLFILWYHKRLCWLLSKTGNKNDLILRQWFKSIWSITSLRVGNIISLFLIFGLASRFFVLALHVIFINVLLIATLSLNFQWVVEFYVLFIDFILFCSIFISMWMRSYHGYIMCTRNWELLPLFRIF